MYMEQLSTNIKFVCRLYGFKFAIRKIINQCIAKSVSPIIIIRLIVAKQKKKKTFFNV